MTKEHSNADLWADVRRRWNEDDLPVLLGKVGDVIVERLSRSVVQREEVPA